MPFRDENTNAGLKKEAKPQLGRSNFDSNETIESGVLIPWASEPEATYVYYECAIGSMLDSGIVVHNRLPQVNRTPDTLSSVDYEDPNLDRLVGTSPTALGVNLRCMDQYKDIVQRMGHSRYWFRLWGQAMRIGYQVPIPGIKTIGGVPAIPYDRNPQWAFNRIAPGGNYGGVILWHAAWSLWYTTAVPPVNSKIHAADPAAHIDSTVKLPAGIQAPLSQSDDEALAIFPNAQRAPNK